MAKSSGKSLVIVESPAKAKTISKFLGKNFQVEASIGHVRDLPRNRADMPEQYKREPWAYLAVNVEDDFKPIYIVPEDKKKQVNKLKAALKDADSLYLATDEDREGEAISWHLHELLKPKVPCIDWCSTKSPKTPLKTLCSHRARSMMVWSRLKKPADSGSSVRVRCLGATVENRRWWPVGRSRAKRCRTIDRPA